MPARTALLVDTEPTISDKLRALLPWRQVKLESTSNTDEAIDCLEQHRYCGIVLNLDLVHGGSRRILRHMAEARTGVPIVLISSSVPDWLHDLANVDDIKLVVSRPFEPSLLAAMILGLCGIEW